MSINKAVKFTDHLRDLYSKAGNTELPKEKRLEYAESIWTESIAFFERNKRDLDYDELKNLKIVLYQVTLSQGIVSYFYCGLKLSDEWTLYNMKAFPVKKQVFETDTYYNMYFDKGLEVYNDWYDMIDFIIRFLNERLPHVKGVLKAYRDNELKRKQDVEKAIIRIQNYL